LIVSYIVLALLGANIVNVSTGIIAAIWALFLGSALMRGLALPNSPPPALPMPVPILELILPLIFFVLTVALAFFQRRIVMTMGSTFLGRLAIAGIDAVTAKGTANDFFARLRFLALLTASALTTGFVGLIATVLTTGNNAAYSAAAFALAVGLGLVAAHLLSIRFPPRLF
jgi:hypothetical protein